MDWPVDVDQSVGDTPSIQAIKQTNFPVSISNCFVILYSQSKFEF